MNRHEEFIRGISGRIEEAKQCPPIDASRMHTVFFLNNVRYALPLSKVREIMRTPPLTPVPGARAYVQGIFSHRGAIIPVIDMAKRFQESQERRRVPEHVLVLEEGGVSYGLLVDRVIDTLSVPPEAIGPIDEIVTEVIPSPYLGGKWIQEFQEKEVPFRYEFFIASPQFKETHKEDSGERAISSVVYMVSVERMIDAIIADTLNDFVIQ